MDKSRVQLLNDIKTKMSEWKKIQESKKLEVYTVEEVNILKEINKLISRNNNMEGKSLERVKISYTPKQISNMLELVNMYINTESK